MSQLLELQVDIMYSMWVGCHNSRAGFTRASLFEKEKISTNKKIGPVSRARVDAALDALVNRGHVCEIDLDDSANVLYGITSKGIYWVEDWFSVRQDGDTFYFQRRRDTGVFVDQLYAQVVADRTKKVLSNDLSKTKISSDPNFWARWGAILTGLGIIVAILLAVIFNAQTH